MLSLRDQVGAIRDQIGLLIEMLPDTWEEGALYDATHLLQKRGHFLPVLKRNNWGFLEGGTIAQAREEKLVDSTVTELRALENRAKATRAD